MTDPRPDDGDQPDREVRETPEQGRGEVAARVTRPAEPADRSGGLERR